MTDLFFYGTLRHVPLLELVLGRAADTISVTPAALEGYAVHTVTDQVFPTLVQHSGARANGILVRNLSEQDLDRLAFYEAGFDYNLRVQPVVLADGAVAQAKVFFPKPGQWQAGALWSLDDWISAWGPLSELAAQEVMAFYGRVGPDQIARSFPAIRTRAWARLAARARGRDPDHDPGRDVIVHGHRRAYIDYFGMDEIEFQHRRYDGTMSRVLNRSALIQGSAVIVLPYDPVHDTVLIVEQFRAPAFLIDDPDPWIWETIAGMIDPGETPEQAAHRESLEEAGVALTSLHCAGGAYTSTGSSTEFVHLFVGLATLTDPLNGGGLDSEGEDIRSKILPFSAFMQMVDAHEFKDLPLLTMAHWLARHRDRLRAM